MRILSGVQASGKLHVGNYFGAIRQFVELQAENECLYFIANLHALTSVRNGKALQENTREVALAFLALGLDPAKASLFRQSDIPEVVELHWILSAISPMGLLEKGHAYKDKVAQGIPADVGLFTYPILMAADILLYGADRVPVGKDQIQHMEMTRDIATKFNLAFVPKYEPKDPDGKEKGHAPGILKLPSAYVPEETATVLGLDGRKMSKSYGNTIDLFADDATIKKKIMSAKSDSTPVEAPKDKEGAIYSLLKLFASPTEMAEVDRTFEQGGLGYGHYKAQILDLFHAHFDAARAKHKELEADPAYVEKVLKDGADKARACAAPIMKLVREAVGY